MQGNPLGRKFKAFVCHDGVFCTLNQYASEELFFPIHDFGGTLWGNRAGYEKWDPASRTGEWATPQLVRRRSPPPPPPPPKSLFLLLAPPFLCPPFLFTPTPYSYRRRF